MITLLIERKTTKVPRVQVFHYFQVLLLQLSGGVLRTLLFERITPKVPRVQVFHEFQVVQQHSGTVLRVVVRLTGVLQNLLR